jgi:hypothetical protein
MPGRTPRTVRCSSTSLSVNRCSAASVGFRRARRRRPVLSATGAAGTRRQDAVPALDGGRGLILAGGRSGVGPEEVSALSERTGWPVVADPVSQMRGLPGAISTVDALLRNEHFAADHLPDIVVRVGRPAASKVLAQWTARATDAGAVLVQVGGPGVIDPERNVVRGRVDRRPPRRRTAGVRARRRVGGVVAICRSGRRPGDRRRAAEVRRAHGTGRGPHRRGDRSPTTPT